MLRLSEEYQYQLKDGQFIIPQALHQHSAKLVHNFRVQYLEDPYLWHKRYTDALVNYLYPNIKFNIHTSGKLSDSQVLISVLWDDITISVPPLMKEPFINIAKIYALLIQSQDVDFSKKMNMKIVEDPNASDQSKETLQFQIDDQDTNTSDYPSSRLEFLNEQLDHILFYPPVINQYLKDSTHEDNDNIIRKYLFDMLFYREYEAF